MGMHGYRKTYGMRVNVIQHEILMHKKLTPRGTDENIGGGDGGGSVEDATIFIRSDKNGQDQE